MKNSSQSIELPSKFEGKKEVSKKKNGTLSQLVIFLKTEKSKNKTVGSAKNLEEEIRTNWQKYSFDANYLKKDWEIVKNNSTATIKTIEFTNPNITSNQAILNFNYEQEKKSIEFAERKFSKFYEINSPYSFIPQIKEKEEEFSTQSKEQEANAEISYPLYNFDEEKTLEN